jgi:Spy/CpxP family protein refolding chaperone
MTQPSRRTILLYLLATFAAGAIAGGFGANAWSGRRAFRPPPPPGDMSKKMMEKFSTELSLSPDQITKIQPIVERTTQRINESHREMGRRMRDLWVQTNDEIRRELTPDQIPKLEEFQQRMARKFGPHGDRPPGDGGGHPPKPPR